MGNVYLTNRKGEDVMVDKTFVFRRCSDDMCSAMCPQVVVAIRPGGQITSFKSPNGIIE